MTPIPPKPYHIPSPKPEERIRLADARRILRDAGISQKVGRFCGGDRLLIGEDRNEYAIPFTEDYTVSRKDLDKAMAMVAGRPRPDEPERQILTDEQAIAVFLGEPPYRAGYQVTTTRLRGAVANLRAECRDLGMQHTRALKEREAARAEIADLKAKGDSLDLHLVRVLKERGGARREVERLRKRIRRLKRRLSKREEAGR